MIFTNKKSVAPPPDQSDYDSEIRQCINEYVTSCVCAALYCPGAFSTSKQIVQPGQSYNIDVM